MAEGEQLGSTTPDVFNSDRNIAVEVKRWTLLERQLVSFDRLMVLTPDGLIDIH